MTTTKPNRRDRLIVLSELQSRIIRQVTLVPIVALTGAVAAITVFCLRLISEAAAVEAVLPSLTPLLITSLTFLGTMAAIIFYQALRFSNRLAGPVYRLKREMEHLRAGNFNRTTRLREGDFLGCLAEEWTTTSKWLHENVDLRPDAKLELPEPDDDSRAGQDAAPGAASAGPGISIDGPAAPVALDDQDESAEAEAPLGSGGRESGALLVELVIGVVITATLLAATIPVCLQHSRLRRLDSEISLAVAACRSNFEEIRAMPFVQLGTLDGVGFDVPSTNGAPQGLRPLPGDTDGLAGSLTVVKDKQISGEILYDIIAEVHWTGVLGAQSFRMSSLFAERKIK